MVPITEVAKRIFKIGPLETWSRTPATSPFLVVGQRAAILEPGETGQTPALLAGIKELGVSLDRIDYIIASHIHLHHIAGLDVLLKLVPNAKVVVHQRGAPHLVEPTRLNESTFQVWGEGCPSISPVPEDRVWGVAGGEVIDLGGRELEIIEAVGHAPHHICIFDRLSRVLFPGDAVGILALGRERARPDILPPLYDLDKAVDSLRRLRAFNPSALFLFGFGGVSHNPVQTLQWGEDDVFAVRDIVHAALKERVSYEEISRRVEEYYVRVGVVIPTGAEGGGVSASGMVAPPFIGMIRYLQRQDPSLETPNWASGRPA